MSNLNQLDAVFHFTDTTIQTENHYIIDYNICYHLNQQTNMSGTIHQQLLMQVELQLFPKSCGECALHEN